VSDDGRPLIADFGLSISTSSESISLAATTEHGDKGTMRWMAKELHWNSDMTTFNPRHTVKTDIWAFGMVICELLTGKVPYASVHKYLVPSFISSGKLPQMPDFRDSADQITLLALWSIARKCWHDEPLERPSAADILQDVEAVSPEVRNVDQNHSDPMLHQIPPISQKMKLDDIFSSLQSLNLAGYIQDKEREPFTRSGSSDVYRARSTKHNKTVVLKRTRANFLGGNSFAERLGREVRLWSRLDHPNVLPLFGFFFEGLSEFPTLVSEFAKNGTMVAYMQSRPFDARGMCEIIYGIANGLEYMHTKQDIVHADLKGMMVNRSLRVSVSPHRHPPHFCKKQQKTK